MNEPDDRSPAGRAATVKGNLYALFRTFGGSAIAEFETRPGACWWHTEIPHPWFNGVLCSQEAAEDAILEEALAFFAARQVGDFTWWLAPEVPTAAWADTLRSHRFHLDANTPGMAVDLAALTATVAHPPALVIRPVEDLATFREWCRVFAQGYGIPEPLITPMFELFSSLGLDWPFGYYLGYINGHPVATSTLFLAAGAAGIYNVATLPEYRGQGIGAALTLAPLQQAREEGYQIGTLQSSQMGYRVYQRLGFETVCRMEHFYWPAEKHPERR